MKVGDRFHLTYCSNIHSGETWPEVSATLADALPQVRGHLAFDGPLAIGLRLSAGAAATLAQPTHLEAFRRFLRAGRYYVPTINGFPYGAFHGTRVKENVYLPDWRQDERVAYANSLSSILAELLGDCPEVEGSVSTVPGAFRQNVRSNGDAVAIATNLLRHAAHLVKLHARTGRTITVAIEPEPACYMETTPDVVAFFEEHLLNRATLDAVERRESIRLTEADVRRHIGLCLDACHLAVEFEEPGEALRRLRTAGIGVFKIQVSAALRLHTPTRAAELLGAFADDTYLHQVVARTSAGLTRYADLPDALEAAGAARSSHAPGDEWRIHYHVPIFLEQLGELETTQRQLVALLDVVKGEPGPACLEVETYTWDVLPAEFRTVDVCTAIARELTWVRRQLET